MPFYGDRAEGAALFERLASVRLAAGDEVVVADNTESGAAEAARHGPASVVRCEVRRSAYAARNVGAERTAAPWILFLDADCVPDAGIVDSFFDPPPSGRAGAVAGAVAGVPDQPGIAPLYARERRLLDQRELLAEDRERPFAVTANILVRREAWEEIGGFSEQTRSGADAEFCWRLREAGWELEYRHGARVEHEHRATLSALLVQAARDGAGERWLARRYAGLRATIPAREVARRLLGWPVWLARGRPRRALVTAVDLVRFLAWNAGTWQSNRPPGSAARRASLVVLLDEFPRRDDPLPGWADAGVRVEALRRTGRPDWKAGRRIAATVLEDDGPLARARALARALRRPRALMSARRGRLGRAELAVAAQRLAADLPGARIACEPALREDAARVADLAGRPGTEIVALAATSGLTSP